LPSLNELNFAYIHVGAIDRMLEWPERDIRGGAFQLANLWLPEAAPARKLGRFKALVRAYGLVDYWRAHGWPDLCRPLGADDFVCD
jgi:hypothetical protein